MYFKHPDPEYSGIDNCRVWNKRRACEIWLKKHRAFKVGYKKIGKNKILECRA